MLQEQRILQNRYLIKKQIGAGGMGAVYLALDQETETIVAIKETISADLRLGRAFEREAQLLSTLRHSALPRVMNYFTEDEGQFIVMEYIAGDDLSEILNRPEPYPVEDVLRWADELLDALDYLHNQKVPVVHRDIKPQNLKLKPDGKIVLLDFGLAKGTPTDLSKLTMTKSIFGYSRNYAPLEQIQGTGTDPRSDLYSLAATLYHLLTGQVPLDALTRATAVLSGEDDLLRGAFLVNSKIPVGVGEILHQAMALNPSVRPESAVAMRFALREAAREPAAEIVSPNLEQNLAASAPRQAKGDFEKQVLKAAPPTFAPKSRANGNRTVLVGAAERTDKPAEPIISKWSLWMTPMRIGIAVLLVGVVALVLAVNRSDTARAVDAAPPEMPGKIETTVKSDAENQTLAPQPPQPVAEVEPGTAADKPINENPVEPKPTTEIAETDEPAVPTPAKKKTKSNAPARETVAQKEDDYEPPVVKQPEPPVVVKREEKPEEKRKKDNVVKGIFDKIGDGAKKLNPFRKKKDKKDND